MNNQITINKKMRESVHHFGRNIQFTGKNGSQIYIQDEATDPECQTVTIKRVTDLGEVAGHIQFTAADFELIVELMSLENRGLRKVEDEE